MEESEEKSEHELPYEPIEKSKYSPFFRLVAALAAVGLFLLSMEGYFYLIHPEPKVRLTLSDIQTFLPSDLTEPFISYDSDEINKIVSDTSGTIKQIANKIAADSCRKADPVCQSKALFYFVRDQIQYVSDAKFHDKLENPLATLKTGGADCEDMSVLLAALEKAIGNEARLVTIPGHVYIQVRIADYKDKWLNMEATCKTCGFNEISSDTLIQRKEFVEI